MKNSFKNLIALARQESSPCVDVAEDVMSSVSILYQRNVNYYRAYTWMGAVSAAIAACIIIATTLSWQSSSDSVSEIMSYVSWVTQ